jgi:hypothetical protein
MSTQFVFNFNEIARAQFRRLYFTFPNKAGIASEYMKRGVWEIIPQSPQLRSY